MPRRVAAPRRLRRRLTVAFVLMAGVSAGVLASGSYVLVRQARLDDSLDRAKAEARFDLGLAQNLPRTRRDLSQFVAAYESRNVHTVLVAGDARFASSPAVNPPIPTDLAGLVAEGRLAYERVQVGRTHYLVVGGRAPGSTTELYFFFSEQRLHVDLAVLRNVLAAGWAFVVLVAGMVGTLLARRTLEPVARASEAARAMAEGLLATRLPVEKQDEFGAWAASFNDMAAALEEKVTALSEAQERERRFTSDVAHELRTPLAALVGEASMLKEHLDRMPEEARRPAQLLVSDVGRLRRLVEDLMEISRLDSGRQELRREPVDLALLIEATVRSRGWTDRVALRTGSVSLLTDRRRVERIVSNLIGNAIDHGGGRATVLAGVDPAGPFVQVSDEGPGIPSEALPRLFDRFYKADRARTGPGSGLGLAIALENARLLGGSLDVVSEPGQGAKFILRLPPGVAIRPPPAPGAGGAVTQPLPPREGRVSASNQDGFPRAQEGGQ